MVSLFSLIVFFFILVIVYSSIATALFFYGWYRKRRIVQNWDAPPDALRVIDEQTDRLKAKAFNIVVVLVLFGITPFVILLGMVWL